MLYIINSKKELSILFVYYDYNIVLIVSPREQSHTNYLEMLFFNKQTQKKENHKHKYMQAHRVKHFFDFAFLEIVGSERKKNK